MDRLEAIIGYTGFVGSHLQTVLLNSADCYNSKNIHDIVGKTYDIVYFAGLPATKWKINQNAEADLKNMLSIQRVLSKCNISRFILFSTIDIYDKGCLGQDEHVKKVTSEPYGYHRYLMEQWVKENYANHHIIRLPALFGLGLKKNIIYDLMHDNNIAAINPFTFYQWYNMDDLSIDITHVLKMDINEINLFSEPIYTLELIKECFPEKYKLVKNNECYKEAALYNFTTRHSPYETKYTYFNPDIIYTGIKDYIRIHNRDTQKLVVSNIGWGDDWEDIALNILKLYGINKVELAITKYEDDWEDIDDEFLHKTRARFESHGMTIYSLQAVFYRLFYNVFTSNAQFLQHFIRVIDIAAILGAKRIVYGSPFSRERPETMSTEEANDVFVSTMRIVAEHAQEKGVIVCLEPNAPAYKCNFMTNLADAVDIIMRINHENVGLNLDTGNAEMVSDDINIPYLKPFISHIQVSRPYLKELYTEEKREEYWEQFKRVNSCVSLEMKPVAHPAAFAKNIKYFVSHY
jgi:sugar phosphate isomerase/epimerase/dTDP-4-dehydrorhamnose reductase